MKRGRARPHFTRFSFYGGYGYVVRIKATTALPLPKFISVLRHSPWMDYGVFLSYPLPFSAVPHSDSPVSKNLNEVHKMKEINLREYYPFYNMDVYLEVSDEIAGQLDRFKLDEEAHRVRVLRAKAYFSLDRGDGIEKDALQKPPQPLELIFEGRAGRTSERRTPFFERASTPPTSGVLSGWQEQIADCKRGKCQ